jgi:tetratricopeptide (TPR) repeat protein
MVMRSRFSVWFLLLLISTLAGVGCASHDAQHATLHMGDYRQLFEKQKTKTLTTDEPAQHLPKMTAEEYQRIGDRYFLQNDLPMAYVHYDKALYLAPTQGNLRYKKGLIFLKRGLAEDALREFQAVLETDDDSALAYQGVGQAFLLMRNLHESEKQFQHAIRLDPTLCKSYQFLGIIYDHQKRFDEAVTAYKTSIALKQDAASLWNNLGVSYYKRGDYDNAIRTFEHVSSMMGAGAQAYNNLGLSLAKLGNYQDALIAFTKGGDPAKAYNNLGVVYLAEGKYREAAAAFEKALALSPRYYPEASDNLNRVRQALQGTLLR